MPTCTYCGGSGQEPKDANAARYDGPELKRLRTNAGISQKTLADILGVTQPYISQIERGKGKIPDGLRADYLAMFGD